MEKRKSTSPGSRSSSKAAHRDAVKTPVGWVRVSFSEGRIERITLGGRVRGITSPHRRSPVPELRRELDQYFSGNITSFSSEINFPHGTPFEKKVWRALTLIPYGETRTYGWVARRIGHPGAHRAVGRACGRNPIPILVPCHRVIRSSGELGGFTGGVGIKRKLLGLENQVRARPLATAGHSHPVTVGRNRALTAKR
jgi:methylated-DNA-[protein]-cysteine S-methyltransferase